MVDLIWVGLLRFKLLSGRPAQLTNFRKEDFQFSIASLSTQKARSCRKKPEKWRRFDARGSDAMQRSPKTIIQMVPVLIMIPYVHLSHPILFWWFTYAYDDPLCYC